MERGSLCVVVTDGRDVHIPRTILFVPDVSLFLENPKHRANRRVAGGLGQCGLHIGRSRMSSGVENVNNLTLPSAEVVVGSFNHLLLAPSLSDLPAFCCSRALDVSGREKVL